MAAQNAGKEISIFSVRSATGKHILINENFVKVNPGVEYETKAAALQDAAKLWPNGRKLKGCWIIKEA